MSRLDHQMMSATESFTSAIQSFDVDTVEKLLKSDFESDYRNTEHYSVLHTAVELIDSEPLIECFEEESNKHLNPFRRLEALQQIVKVILESRRFNVNALTVASETALHLAVSYCRCKQFSPIDAYDDLINAIIRLLLKYNANINAKNIFGETPLMLCSQRGCSHIVKLLLDWRDELGAGVDLNATDMFGETALIKAASWANVDVIDLLLQHGCLDKFQDHRGFCALHAAIYGSDIVSSISRDFLALIGVLASEEMPVVLDRYAAHSNIGTEIKDWPRDDSIQETVGMLVTRGCADINCLDFRGNTALDLALKSKLHISAETVEKLKEYGGTSGALVNKLPEYPKNILEFTDKLGKTPLHHLSAVLPELTLEKKVEILMHRLSSSPHKETFEELTLAKDHRGRTALHYAVTDMTLKSEDIFLLINVLKLKPTINERDNYGRTPLHYCEDEGIFKSLVEQGANEHMQDIDGKTPQVLMNLRNEERNRHNFSRRLADEENQEQSDVWMIWNSEYACSDQFSKRIDDRIRHFMNKLSDEIGKRDPRFECRPVLIGSANEGTKTGLPDEFEFNFILTKLSKLCEVVMAPEAPTGFVHLKRRCNHAEYWPENQNFQSQEKFDRFFNSGGFLLTTEIASRFRFLYSQVMKESEFWQGEDFFEWDPHNEGGVIYATQEGRYRVFESANDVSPSGGPCTSIKLKLNRPIEDRYMFTLITLDIVPCIHIDGWWPEKALPSLSDEMKLGGCHLMFDDPQSKYPWVPFSDPLARISFAPAESRIIRECSAVAKAAYMVGKHLTRDKSMLMSTYVLKTCLLYCIEALKDCTGNSLLYEDINPPELRIFVEKLMQCFHEFYLQDFVPCYMMPSFHLPVEDYMKSKHDGLLNDSSFRYPLFAFSLYSSVCATDSRVDFCPPIAEPLSEKFNREKLLRKLSVIRSYAEDQPV